MNNGSRKDYLNYKLKIREYDRLLEHLNLLSKNSIMKDCGFNKKIDKIINKINKHKEHYENQIGRI